MGGGTPSQAPSGQLRWAGSPRVWSLVAVATGALVWIVLLAPVGELVEHLSPGGISRAFAVPGAWRPLLTSLAASGLALGLLVVVGTPLGWALARRRLPATGVWEAGLLIPLLMPPLVIGLLLVFLWGPRSGLGGLLADVHLSATDTFLALVLAELYESAPYYILGAQAAFAGVDPALEEAARMLGDPPARALRRVSLPLAAPGLAAALATGWARAMGAFGAVLIIAYHPYGLPMQIWTTLEEVGLPGALPFALVLLVVALPLPLAAYSWSARARLRR